MLPFRLLCRHDFSRFFAAALASRAMMLPFIDAAMLMLMPLTPFSIFQAISITPPPYFRHMPLSLEAALLSFAAFAAAADVCCHAAIDYMLARHDEAAMLPDDAAAAIAMLRRHCCALYAISPLLPLIAAYAF